MSVRDAIQSCELSRSCACAPDADAPGRAQTAARSTCTFPEPCPLRVLRRRSRSINAGVARASVADWSDDDNDDDESVIDDDEDDVDNTPRQRGARFARFAWPADVEAGEPAGASTDAEVPAADATVRDASADMSTADLQPILLGPAATENTPLLQPAVSFPDDVHPERTQPRPTSYHTKLNRTSTMSTTKSRRSDRSARRSHHDHLGRSTYGQTVGAHLCMLRMQCSRVGAAVQ
jgi:hypothetical protein